MNTFSVIGYGQRGIVYAGAAKDKGQLSAVCDYNPSRLEQARSAFALPQDCLFSNEKDFFAKGKLSDYLFICTPDHTHYNITMQALALGYDILLEKPIARSAAECLEIEKAAERLGRKVIVCHVLRYTPFYQQLKALIEAGTIGRLISIEQTENVGYWHMAHSFVRGNWASEKESNPMILAKCCHDTDILQYLAGSLCKTVSSDGELIHFRPECAPSGAPSRCTDNCPYERKCPYSAKRIYIDNFKKIIALGKKHFWPYSVLPDDGIATVEKLTKAIKEGPYGKCVYAAGNDVVDYQNVQMVFENGVRANLTMTAFSKDLIREIAIRGTHGEIRGIMEKRKIIIKPFIGKNKRVKVRFNIGGHGGGDSALVTALFSKNEQTGIKQSVASHLIAFGAEVSRKSGKAVDINKTYLS